MEFKDKLKKLRTEAKMSQQSLADALGISKGELSKYESGRAYPSKEAIKKMASIFHVNSHYFNDDKSLKSQKIVLAVLLVLLLAIVSLLIAFLFYNFYKTTIPVE